VIRATPEGRRAQEVWRPLFGVIEKRWEQRFGKDQIDQLRKSLGDLLNRIDTGLPDRALPDRALPDCLPILGYGLFSRGPERERRAPAGLDLALSALLSRVLLAFAIEFERESDLSLAIGANVLRVLDEKGVRARDLPLPSGVSKEAIAEAYRRLLGIVEERWQTRFGKDAIETLRELLERLVGKPLFRGLEPYAAGWRASVRKPGTLPHYPMVLHRGGFPDGS
jgi:hypothetical protein